MRDGPERASRDRHEPNDTLSDVLRPWPFNTLAECSGTSRSDFSGDGLRSFYFVAGNYYQVAERQVDLGRDLALPTDAVPGAFFVAQWAGIILSSRDLRRRGVFHFAPDIYYFREVLLTGKPPASGKRIQHVTRK